LGHGGILYSAFPLSMYSLVESMTSEVDHSHVAFVCFCSLPTLSIIFTDAQGGERLAGNYISASKWFSLQSLILHQVVCD